MLIIFREFFRQNIASVTQFQGLLVRTIFELSRRLLPRAGCLPFDAVFISEMSTCSDTDRSNGDHLNGASNLKRELDQEDENGEIHQEKKIKTESLEDVISDRKNHALSTQTLENISQDVGQLDNEVDGTVQGEKKIVEGDNVEAKTETDQTSVKTESDQVRENNLPRKRKCALLLSYCGAGYNGMQMNPGVNTIEEELVNALYKAGAITLDCKTNPRKMSFQRSARTDKGVSAAKQVVSLKMIPAKSLLPKINEYLPPEIRVFEMVKTTKGFDSKLNCSARTYEYLLPTFAFAKDYQTTKDYRITDEKINEINEILSIYLGTRNYHNFTSGKKFEDPSAKRYILSFKCNKPFIRDDREFIVLTVKGQSFVLHQIRKMIGLAIAVARGVAPKSTFDLAWEKKKVDIPKAPALGLALEMVHFDAYNKKFGSDGFHDPLNWVNTEEEVNQFKAEFIHNHMIETEIKDNVMMRWLNTLPGHTYTNAGMEEIGTITRPMPNDDTQSVQDGVTPPVVPPVAEEST